MLLKRENSDRPRTLVRIAQRFKQYFHFYEDIFSGNAAFRSQLGTLFQRWHCDHSEMQILITNKLPILLGFDDLGPSIAVILKVGFSQIENC